MQNGAQQSVDIR